MTIEESCFSPICVLCIAKVLSVSSPGSVFLVEYLALRRARYNGSSSSTRGLHTQQNSLLRIYIFSTDYSILRVHRTAVIDIRGRTTGGEKNL